MPMVSCQKCATEFHAKPSWVKKGFGKFCSAACHHESNRTGKEMPCDVCGKLSYKTLKDLKGSKSGKFFCDKSCQTRWRNQLYIGENHKNFKTGEFVYRGVIERAGVPKICNLCRNKNPRILAVHHIDKNRRNNSLKNLAWLCHNCHFLVHHYEDARERLTRVLRKP